MALTQAERDWFNSVVNDPTTSQADRTATISALVRDAAEQQAVSDLDTKIRNAQYDTAIAKAFLVFFNTRPQNQRGGLLASNEANKQLLEAACAQYNFLPTDPAGIRAAFEKIADTLSYDPAPQRQRTAEELQAALAEETARQEAADAEWLRNAKSDPSVTAAQVRQFERERNNRNQAPIPASEEEIHFIVPVRGVDGVIYAREILTRQDLDQFATGPELRAFLHAEGGPGSSGYRRREAFINSILVGGR